MNLPRAVWLGLWLCWASWNASGAGAEDIVVRPRPGSGPIDNPLKGWCPYTDAGPIYQPYSMVFQTIAWRELEPIENDYHFDQWEQAWDSQLGSNKHVVIRVTIDYPSRPSGLPDWLRRQGVRETSYTDYGGGKSPDYDDPRMVTAMERLIAALGQRYNGHPRIAFVQLGLLGFWGEWHTYPRNELYASPATEQRIVDAYRQAFPQKILMARYARDYAGKQAWIGFHDDMFPEDTDNGQAWSFLAGIRQANRADNWQLSVIGGEMVPHQATRWLGRDFPTTVTMLQRSHFTWIGPYCPALEKGPNVAYRKNCEDLVRQLGYQYQLTKIMHPADIQDTLPIQLEGINQGVAPFYYPWQVEWALLDARDQVASTYKTHWDIRRWLPGSFSESTKIDVRLPAGRYRLALGIRDPWQDRPAIRFANELDEVNHWTVVSELTVR